MTTEKLQTVKVFTYGTLRKGECREGVLRNSAIRWERAAILGFDLYDLGSFPCIIDSKNGRQVFGELVECTNPEAIIKRLDGIEGYNPNWPPENNLYIRREVNVVCLDNGRREKAIVYVFANNDNLCDQGLIESGNWESKNKGRWANMR